MKDEIKEILNQLEIVSRKHTIEVCEDGSKIETMPASVVDELRLNNYSAKLLLDYITNLQEENERLKDLCDKYEEEHNTKFNEWVFDKRENESWRRVATKNFNDAEDYKLRIDKAIEYLTSYESISAIQGLNNIEKNKQLDENTMNIMTSRYLDVHHNLLNILEGENNE